MVILVFSEIGGSGRKHGGGGKVLPIPKFKAQIVSILLWQFLPAPLHFSSFTP